MNEHYSEEELKEFIRDALRYRKLRKIGFAVYTGPHTRILVLSERTADAIVDDTPDPPESPDPSLTA